MTELATSNRTELLATPFRPGNGVPPPSLAGRDAMLTEFERFLAEHRPVHASWTLTGLRGTVKTVLRGEFAGRGERTCFDQVVARLLERGLVYQPSRGRYDVVLPLFRAYLRQRGNLTELSRGR